MGRFSERRALYYEDEDGHDPSLSIDVNEYLIENYEAISLKQRRSIWSLCQNDEDFDYSSIEEQIDSWVIKFAKTDPTMNVTKKITDYIDPSELEDKEYDEEEYDEDEEDDEDYEDETVYVDVREYLEDKFEDIPEEEIQEIVQVAQAYIDYTPIIEQLDVIVDEYYDDLYEDFLNGDEDDEDDDDED